MTVTIPQPRSIPPKPPEPPVTPYENPTRRKTQHKQKHHRKARQLSVHRPYRPYRVPGASTPGLADQTFRGVRVPAATEGDASGAPTRAVFTSSGFVVARGWLGQLDERGSSWNLVGISIRCCFLCEESDLQAKRGTEQNRRKSMLRDVKRLLMRKSDSRIQRPRFHLVVMGEGVLVLARGNMATAGRVC